MNWFNSLKISMPLPVAKNYPETKNLGLGFVDRNLPEDESEELSKENLSYLGHGGNGVAFTDSQGVIKITGDHSEAYAGEMLMQNPCPCIVKVYQVQPIQTQPNLPRMWKLRLEQVKPLSGKYEEWAYIFASYLERMEFPDNHYILDQINKDKSWYYRTYAGAKPFNQKEFDFYYSKFSSFIKCIRSSGYECLDLVPDNMGLRGDQYVVLDIGSVYKI